jgi:hypothetical protein
LARSSDSVVKKWHDLEHVPSALHANDYAAVIEDQKSPLEETMECVFNRPGFTHIEGKTLYEVYKLMCAEASPGQYIRGRKKFLAHVRRWLNIHKPGVEWCRVKIRTYGDGRTMGTVFKCILDLPRFGGRVVT